MCILFGRISSMIETFVESSRNPQRFKPAFDYLTRLTDANDTLRFTGNSLNVKHEQKGRKESISEHMWSLHHFCTVLSPLCPELSSAVQFEEVKDILLMHDLPEIKHGDITRTTQISTENIKTTKVMAERQALEELTVDLPAEMREKYLERFDYFEGLVPSQEVPIEILVARMIDSMQGDHYFLHHTGPMEAAQTEITARIMQKYTLKNISEVVSRLHGIGKHQAADEVIDLADYHFGAARKLGVSFPYSFPIQTSFLNSIDTTKAEVQLEQKRFS